MTAEHWFLVGFIVVAIVDMVSFWGVVANHARRICELEALVMRQDHTRRAYEAEMRIAERRRGRGRV